MGISRRQLLSLLPTAGLVTAITPEVAQAQPTAAGDPGSGAADADVARLLANTVAMFAGDPEVNGRAEVAPKLAAIDKTARTWLAAMKDTDGPGGELFAGIPLGTSDPNLTASFQHLYEIALATAVPGGPGGPASDLAGNTDVRRRVLDGLAWLHEHYYGDQAQGYYGNWFNWEIGISTHVSRTLVLLAEEVRAYRPALARTYVASMDAYLRNGKEGDVDLDSRFHTGANLADITTNRILQGAVLADEARVGKAVADQLTVFATVDPYHLQHGVTDGYYADGSFVQHDSVAYTGSYGKGLLTRVVQTLKILDGTSYMHGDGLVSVVDGWVRNGFAPLIFEGWMMEVVKGRAVSRTTTGYADVAVVVEAVVDLSGCAGGDAARALKSYVKSIGETSRAALDPTRFVSPVSIARYADMVADDTIPARDLNPASRSVAFNAMDRHVHLRPGYAFALARSSNRISKYEYMNGENLQPWFSGDGAYHLYLSGQDQAQAYGVDYFTTVSPYALAGVTSPVEHRRTIPELYGTPYYDNPDHPLHFTSSSESQNTYVYFPRGTNRHSGGAVLGAFGAAAMVQSDDVACAAKREGLLPEDFVAYQNATAHKSWFMLDEEIVVLAAGVGDLSGRAVLTTVDSRTAAPTDSITISGARRDGSAWAGTGTADLAWLRYANADQGTSVGYVFLDTTGPVRVANEQVTRSRRVVRTANPDTAVTRSVFGVHLDHAPGVAPSSLAYALVPNATERQLGSYGEGRVVVVANTTQVQAVRHTGLGLTAVNTFGAGPHNVAGLRVNGAASVLVHRRRDGRTEVAVADPTTDRETISVVLRGRSLTPVAPAEGVRVSAVAGGTRLDVDTYQLYGRSRTVALEL